MLAVDGSGRVLRSNAAFRRMIGRAGGTDETDPLTIATWTRPEDLVRDQARSLAFVTGHTGQDTMEKTYVRADGTTFDALLSAAVARDASGRPLHVLCHVMDVSERTAHARELERLALTDGLTGLPNRRRMEDRLGRALAGLDDGGTVGLVLLDLDHFKVVNDSLGHGAGDALLVDVAARLRSAVPEGTTVARLGGDEFVVVVTGDAAGQVHEVTTALLASLARPFDLDGTTVVATASLGVAVGDRTGTPWELLRQADLALYRAKETGRDRVVAFDAALRTRADERLATEAVLRRALELGWLRLHLQPVVELDGEQVVGAEALVRLEHPDRGLLLPGAFMDVAEETGLVTALDDWVLVTAVAGLAARPGTRVAVNVSARTLEAGGLAERVGRVLAEHAVDPRRLSVELTETSLLRPRRDRGRRRAGAAGAGLPRRAGRLRDRVTPPCPTCRPSSWTSSRSTARSSASWAAATGTTPWSRPWSTWPTPTASSWWPRAWRTTTSAACCGRWAATRPRAGSSAVLPRPDGAPVASSDGAAGPERPPRPRRGRWWGDGGRARGPSSGGRRIGRRPPRCSGPGVLRAGRAARWRGDRAVTSSSVPSRAPEAGGAGGPGGRPARRDGAARCAGRVPRGRRQSVGRGVTNHG